MITLYFNAKDLHAIFNGFYDTVNCGEATKVEHSHWSTFKNNHETRMAKTKIFRNAYAALFDGEN